MWTLYAAIAAPIIAGVFGVLQARVGSGLHKQLKEHASILAELKDPGAARSALDNLVTFEAEKMLERQRVKLARTLNGTNLVLSVILLVVSAATIYWMTLIVQWAWGAGWGGWAFFVAALIGIFMLLLTGAGFGTLYNPKTPARTKKSK